MMQTARAYALPLIDSVLTSGVRACALLCACVSLFFSSVAAALPPQELIMDPPAAVVEKGMLTLKLALTVDNEEGLLALLKDGAVLELAVSAGIERERAFWRNAALAGAEFSSILRHDPLSRDFVVLVPTPEGEKEIRDRSLTRLLQASWRRLSLPVVPFADMPQDEPAAPYLVRIVISLRHTDVPPWLEKSSVFWSAELVPRVSRNFMFTPPDSSGGPR